MKYRQTRGALVAAIALFGTGCIEDLPIEPDTPVEIKLDFCSNDVPIWFASQTNDDAWAVITPDGSGTFTFNALQRTGVAFVRQSGSDSRTDVIFTTSGDLQKVSGQACFEEFGTKQVSGSVSGLADDQIALAGMAFSSAYLTPPQTTFTLTQLPDRPLDFIGSRFDVTTESQHANKTVIRRAQNPTSGATLAVVNFGTEGVVPSTQTAVVSGIGGESALLANDFFSQLETFHTLSTVNDIADGPTSFVAVPAAQLVDGDYHDLFVFASTQTGGVRGVEVFFRNPVNPNIVLGPPLAEPRVTVIVSDPALRLRMQMAGQIDYSTSIMIEYHQDNGFSNTDVVTTVTASYTNGTPFEWNVPSPNFAGVPGWDDAWSLQPGDVSWTVSAFFGKPELLFGARPAHNDVVRFASRSSSISAAVAAQTAQRSIRQRHFAPVRWR